jgi:hypothetical protein
MSDASRRIEIAGRFLWVIRLLLLAGGLLFTPAAYPPTRQEREPA